MKKYLFLLLLLPLIATSQTKAETEDWIISKFNRWKQNITNYDLQFGAFESYTDFKTLKIDGCNLIITTNKTISGLVDKKKEVRIIKIGDIEELKWYKDELFILTRKTNVLVKTYDLNTNNFETKTYVKGAKFKINTNAENNLKNRMLKALNHLKSFCKPTIDEKETF